MTLKYCTDLSSQHGLEVGDDAGLELLGAADVEHLHLLLHHARHSVVNKIMDLYQNA